jgi:CheY-like chemotaxis protein
MASVIVIDDDPTITNMIGLVLQLENERYQIASTTDSREGLRLIYAAPPSVIVLGLIMPYLTGMDILERLRSTPDVRARHVILLYSGNHRLESVARKYAVDGYLTKYAPNTELIEMINTAAQALQDRNATT